jgi:aminoglycoside 6'-N-acetyltransferase I
MGVVIRHAVPADAREWQRLRTELWPDGADDHGPEIAAFFAGAFMKDLTAILVATDAEGIIVGFAELSARTDIAGLQGQRAGYVEGLWVRPELRGRGVAAKLLQASRAWAREQGCTAFASDRAERIIVDARFAAKSC